MKPRSFITYTSLEKHWFEIICGLKQILITNIISHSTNVTSVKIELLASLHFAVITDNIFGYTVPRLTSPEPCILATDG